MMLGEMSSHMRCLVASLTSPKHKSRGTGILAAACGGKLSSSFLPSCKSGCHCIGQRGGKEGIWQCRVVFGETTSHMRCLVASLSSLKQESGMQESSQQPVEARFPLLSCQAASLCVTVLDSEGGKEGIWKCRMVFGETTSRMWFLVASLASSKH